MNNVLADVNRYFQKRFGLENSKGDAILQKKCWIGTVPDGKAWKTVICEPLATEGGVFVFRITCETEQDSPFQLRHSWQELLAVGPKAAEFRDKVGHVVVVG